MFDHISIGCDRQGICLMLFFIGVATRMKIRTTCAPKGRSVHEQRDWMCACSLCYHDMCVCGGGEVQ